MRETGKDIVNVSSGIALVGMPFYATYAAAKAGLAQLGGALRRELLGESIHVLIVYPPATDTPMMDSSKAGPESDVHRESAEDVAAAIVDAIAKDALDVIRGGEARMKMVTVNFETPAVFDEQFKVMKPTPETAVKDHSAL